MGLLAHPLAAFAVLPLLGTLVAKVVSPAATGLPLWEVPSTGDTPNNVWFFLGKIPSTNG